MKRFYNNPAWCRIRGLRGLGTLALSIAFCLTGLLALSSCDLDFWDDDDNGVEPIEMRGFYTSVNMGGDTDCVTEIVKVSSERDDVVGGEPNVTLTASSSAFGEGFFPQIGIRVGESDNNPATIVSAYVSETGETFDRPGAYFLAATTDDAVVQGETIYTGYWTGYAYRPGGEGTLKPVVICPYVLVPIDTLDVESCGGTKDPDDESATTANGTDPDMVHTGLQKYLTQDNGNGLELRSCYNVFDSDGRVSPEQRMP
ncbi:MAG: hypothetical protein F4X55_05680 [Candidatus Dadabacteria bacterium]|nr:hypothetical protein [Candidatus Dadabacteria bacterium]MYC40483.1 hypothetical protein [Candidatus Dadabacteria bacterium]